MLPNRRPNLSHYDKRVPPNLVEPLRAVQNVPSRSLIKCFTALALCRGVEDKCGFDGNLHVWSPRCSEDEFPDGCAKVGPIMTIQRSWADANSITVERLPRMAVCFECCQSVQTNKNSTKFVLCFTSKLLLVLVISNPQKLTASPSWRSTTTIVKCRSVFTCSKKRSCDGRLVPCPPRHPCDKKRSNLLMVFSDRCARFFTNVEGSGINWS